MIACSGLFYKPERAHFTAPPFKSNPLPLGFDLVLGVKLGGRHQYCYDIPRRSKGRFAPTSFFQEERHPLLHLFRERAYSRRLFVCRRAYDSSGRYHR